VKVSAIVFLVAGMSFGDHWVQARATSALPASEPAQVVQTEPQPAPTPPEPTPPEPVAQPIEQPTAPEPVNAPVATNPAPAPAVKQSKTVAKRATQPAATTKSEPAPAPEPAPTDSPQEAPKADSTPPAAEASPAPAEQPAPAPQPAAVETASVQAEPGLESELLSLLNADRAAADLPPLALDTQLRTVARNHSQDMWVRDFFAHVNPDGLSPFQRIRAAGISYATAGENLAQAATVQAAHTALLDSPTHRDNILKPSFGRVGIGIVRAGAKGLLITQNFRD